MSNLHRQIIHSQEKVGVNKALSAAASLQTLNPTIDVTTVTEPLTHENALELVSAHDLVVDACDNPRTRYILNDACVLANKVLVSGSAMGTEGQLTVYDCRFEDDDDDDDDTMDGINHNGDDRKYAEKKKETRRKRRGPCYRCLYPHINASEGCKSCSDNGVLGPVPGLIGILQSVEVMKILTGIGTTMDKRLIMYDSLSCSFFSLKKTPPNPKCAVCSPNFSTIKSMEDSQKINAIARGPNNIVNEKDRTSSSASSSQHNASSTMSVTNLPSNLQISCKEYHEKYKSKNDKPHVLLDVRVKRQYEMCALDNSINIPLNEIKEKIEEIEKLSDRGTKPIFCLCRRGIASAEATRIIQDAIGSASHDGILSVYNIDGGLNAWVEEVDPSFPKY
mmetsp:Transcript_59971/g.89058  ORF Transcript_59971/g.89058 Transcript_59971/m.89058 type:complete len:392 (+) Transcript_59971:490-1665(+)